MKDYKILKFLDLFKGLFEKIDIDYEAMRKILSIKLLLDSRRVSTVINSGKEPNKDRNNFALSLGIYFIMGLIFVPVMFLQDNFLFQMNMIFGVVIFLLLTSLIGDFSSVLLDLRDKEIILSKPINSRTINMAKIIHIFMYISMITLALVGPALIASLKLYGLYFFLLFLVEIILMALFVIVLTALTYLVILRFFDGEKLKDIINYVQIGLTISLTVGFQFVSRAFQFIDINKISFEPTWWKYLLPSIWFSAPFELLINNNKESYIIGYSVLALVVPIISIVLYIKLIPTFENNLQKLNSSGQSREKGKFSNLISNVICRTKEERTFYKFAGNMMRNERTFKLKVYPQLGFSLVFPFLMIFTALQGAGGLSKLSEGTYFFIYFIGFMIPYLLEYLQYSGNYKGAWIYKTIPIKDINIIYKGTIKAAFINLITPVFLAVAVLFLFIFKSHISYNLVITYFTLMLYTRIAYIFIKKELPFSKAFEISESRGKFLLAIISWMALGVLTLVHIMIDRIVYGPYIYLFVLLIMNKVAWNIKFTKSKTLG